MVKTDELCSCKYPQEVQALGTRGICQSCDREIFQGPRNSVERYLYNRILATEAKLDKAVLSMSHAVKYLESTGIDKPENDWDPEFQMLRDLRNTVAEIGKG